MLTLEESYQEYFHYLAKPFERFLTYREWKKKYAIQVETEPWIVKLAEKMGYPGHTDEDDLKDYIDDELSDIWYELSLIREALLSYIGTNFSHITEWLDDINTALIHTITYISNSLNTFSRTFMTTIINLGIMIQDTIDIAYSLIRNVLYAMQQHLESIYKGVEEAIIASFSLVQESFKTVVEWATETLQDFYKNIKGGFSSIADAIVAGIDAIAKVIIAIIDGVALIISKAITVLGDTIIGVVHSVERMVTDILQTASTTIEEALTTVGGVMLEISHRFFSFLENIFPEDVNVLADGLAFIFEAQRLAAEKIKAKVGAI